MKGEKKTSFLKKIFGQKSSCCSLELEDVDSTEDAPNCCGSTLKPAGCKKQSAQMRFEETYGVRATQDT